MRTALDTNILSALWAGEQSRPSILRHLHEAKNAGALLLAPIVYCELLAHPNVSDHFVDTFLSETSVSVDFVLPQQVWDEAGRRFSRYARRRRTSHGHPRRLVADFLVGAHALISADRLMTMDTQYYKQDFPELKLICP